MVISVLTSPARVIPVFDLAAVDGAAFAVVVSVVLLTPCAKTDDNGNCVNNVITVVAIVSPFFIFNSPCNPITHVPPRYKQSVP